MNETTQTSHASSARVLLIIAGVITVIFATICAGLVGLVVFALSALPTANVGIEAPIVAALITLLLFGAVPGTLIAYGVFAYRAERYRRAFISSVAALITAAVPGLLLFMLSFGGWMALTTHTEELPLRPPPPELTEP